MPLLMPLPNKHKLKAIHSRNNMKWLLLIWVGFYSLGNAQNTYNKYLTQVQKQREQLAQKQLNTKVLNDCSQLLYNAFAEEIFPAWLGTPWDFNGISNEPQKGKIACGYFVSTTLKHLGSNLNRYKVAQQASATIVKAFAPNQTKKFYSLDQLTNYLYCQEDQIYVLGLDYHVGFILIQNQQSFFVHSDYFHNQVVKEPIENSIGLQNNQLYVLGSITKNKHFLKKWLLGSRFYH